ncbi:hypothetical protein XAP7430_200074 [Xanthomonas phaseoli pv. phaseoli]|uniref:Uncharacterized protein n=1 Tax=Xanthomonas campestris pv. phaseoli TaxID=317013 RepID=A0AB38DWZ5_XANCH|nr:hypothetical protein XAP6984_260019 [Xanthomonas phaseoli pv. phaseoli]SON85347.1 hypothetical protein XAP7430_200074 [Xanthomonas phaseoli pv. phaseoli]
MYSRHGFASASLVEAGHPQRQEVERFIAAVYLRRYGAQLRSFLPQLLVYRDADGALMAAVGMRIGSAGALFVEQYLDEPAESAWRPAWLRRCRALAWPKWATSRRSAPAAHAH